MAQATGAVKNAVGQMSATLSELKGSSASAIAAVVDDLGNKLPVAAVRANNALQQVGASAGQSRMGLQVLSYQISDVATQFSMGTNPMMIFAQQGNQVVQAIALMRGSAGGFVGFLAGPWGSAILGAVSILGVMWAAHSKAADAQDEQTDASKDLKKATDELRSATEREISTTQSSTASNIRQAQSLRDRAVAARQAAVAELELARAKLSASTIAASGSAGQGVGGAAGSFIGGQASVDRANVNTLNAEIERQNNLIAKNEQSIRAGRGVQIQQEVAEATDASAAAAGRYERRVYALTQALSAGRMTEQAYKEEVLKATNARNAAEEAAKKSGGSKKTGGSKKSGGDKDEMSKFEALLASQRVSHERMNQQNNTFYGFSEQAEASFWQNILSQQGLSADLRLQVEQKYLAAASAVRQEAFSAQINGLRDELDLFQNNQQTRLEIATDIANQMKEKYGEASNQYLQAQDQVTAISRASAAQQKAINNEIMASNEQAAYSAVEYSQRQADLELELGIISKTERIQQEVQFENERFNIASNSLQEKLALMEQDPDMNPIEYQRIKNEILEIERQHQLNAYQLRSEAALQSNQTQFNAINAVSQAWGDSIAKTLMGFQSFSQGVRGLYMGLVNAITQMLQQMIAQWIAKKLAALILGKVASKVNAISEITAQAGVAGAAAVASTAAIPVVGPPAAPAAGAAASAAALAFLPMVAAEGGWDVPAGVNPITQLHQKEMVLPAEQADVIRDMAEGGSGSGGSGGPVHLHLHGDVIHNPTQLRQWFEKNQSAVSAGVKRYARNGGSL
jgi:hypothetical protein